MQLNRDLTLSSKSILGNNRSLKEFNFFRNLSENLLAVSRAFKNVTTQVDVPATYRLVVTTYRLVLHENCAIIVNCKTTKTCHQLTAACCHDFALVM